MRTEYSRVGGILSIHEPSTTDSCDDNTPALIQMHRCPLIIKSSTIIYLVFYKVRTPQSLSLALFLVRTTSKYIMGFPEAHNCMSRRTFLERIPLSAPCTGSNFRRVAVLVLSRAQHFLDTGQNKQCGSRFAASTKNAAGDLFSSTEGIMYAYISDAL